MAAPVQDRSKETVVAIMDFIVLSLPLVSTAGKAIAEIAAATNSHSRRKYCAAAGTDRAADQATNHGATNRAGNAAELSITGLNFRIG
jgi:hypothetical protein